ncbi:MAG: YbgA family protein [Methanomassiliicoccales archaeon]
MPDPKPRVVISRCIEFEACRYNGAMIKSEFVLRLMPYVEFLPVCMEADMGLGVPRDPIRIVHVEGEDRLLQPSTGRDVTETALRFTREHLANLRDVDGFLLKNRSPSCGIKDVRVYPPGEAKAALTAKGSGIFAREVMSAYPQLAVEDEARLLNGRIADHFLTRIFTSARFRGCLEKGTSKALMDFHARHKLLLMGYSQAAMRRLGRITASQAPIEERLQEYSAELHSALRRPPNCRSWNNVMMHAMGYFSESLDAKEKQHFLRSLEWYAEGKVPLSAPLLMVRSWALKQGEEYLLQQILFEPYPEEFMGLLGTEACTGRDLWEDAR